MQGRLNGTQRNKLKSLFDMMYSPRELAEEIGFDQDRVYIIYVPLGCPHERDEQNHILINGLAFAEWYIKEYAKVRLAENETFCKTCKKGVKISKPTTQAKGSITYILSICPHCGRNLTKITGYKR